MKNFLEKFFIVEGILFGLLGILFFINPFDTLVTFINLCGILIFIIGISTLIRAFNSENKVFLILNGVISIVLGAIIFLSPVETMSSLALFLGIWALIRGIYLLIVLIKYSKLGLNFNTFYVIALIVLGVLILFNPFAAVLTTPYIIGTYFIVTAVCEIYLGFKL